MILAESRCADEKRQLNAIVGGAIRALVESGADDEIVGAFSATYRTQVAKILGFTEKSFQPLDLVAIVQAAVRLALKEADGSVALFSGSHTQSIN
jgi:hypothetical protein